MRKIIAIVMAVLMLAAMTACQPAVDDGKYVIGISQFMPHDALDQATQGFKDAVIAGLGEENVVFEQEDCAGDPANCASAANALVSAKVDLIMANATPAVQAVANATKTIPVLGTSVTEYGVALGVENFSGLTGSNVSGTSDLADLEKQAKMILQWCPDVKNVGLLYCLAEANSEYQVKEVQKYLELDGVTCKMFGFTDTNDMSSVVQDAANWSDSIYVPTDNTVADNAAVVDSVCRPAKIPVFAGEEGICKKCGVATLSISYYELGYTTGEMQIQYAPNVTFKYNADICEALGISPVEGYEPIG